MAMWIKTTRLDSNTESRWFNFDLIDVIFVYNMPDNMYLVGCCLTGDGHTFTIASGVDRTAANQIADIIVESRLKFDTLKIADLADENKVLIKRNGGCDIEVITIPKSPQSRLPGNER